MQTGKEIKTVYDQNFIDAVALVGFLVDLANYKENLTQSDKDDIMQRLDKQSSDILTRVEHALEEQNEMLREILDRLDGK